MNTTNSNVGQLAPVEQSWPKSVAIAWDTTTTFAKECATQAVDTLSPCINRVQTLHPLLWIVLLWDFYVVSKVTFDRVRSLGKRYSFTPAIILAPVMGLLAVHAVQRDPIYILMLAIIGILVHVPFKPKKTRKRKLQTGPPRRSERLRQKRENSNN